MGAPISITPHDWSAGRFEGIALSFVTHHKERRVTWDTVRGAVDLALRWGATPEELAHRVGRVAVTAYCPDPARLDELKRLTESLRKCPKGT
jgi:hypothetical protein